MAVWSSFALKNFAKIKLNRFKLFPIKNQLQNAGRNQLIIRSCHSKTFVISPSRFTFEKMRDLICFFSLLAVIPIGFICTYFYLFIGPATLALIPEDYEPKHWEYHRDPIVRFMARYVYSSPQERHERNLHSVFHGAEYNKLKNLQKRIKEMIRDKEDYQSWYYVDPLAKYYRAAKEDSDNIIEKFGHTGPRMF